MDSLTQIVLGASMGEAVAGRKIGNRAMLWGAIAGTIPDLDVFGGLFGMSPEDNLAFHRGISHSILFAIIAPALLALYTNWIYKNRYHQSKGMKWTTAVAGVLFLIFCGVIINAIPFAILQNLYWPTLLGAILLVGFFSYRLIVKYALKEQEEVEISYARWYLLFFVAILTHPILDSCTGYGTQLFQPFSDYRVAWNNISVADPLYTFPFLVFLIMAATRNKNNRWRTILNYAGFAWSMIYMSITLVNKYKVDRVFTDSLQEKNIEYSRCMTTPTILNNILWHCIAEGDSVYYDGFYSLWDKQDKVEISQIKKNHELISLPDDKRVDIIRWFSNEYFNVLPLNGDTIQINDLRYGAQIGGSTNNPRDYIFPFILSTDGERYYMQDQQGPPEGSMEEFWNALVARIKGV